MSRSLRRCRCWRWRIPLSAADRPGPPYNPPCWAPLEASREAAVVPQRRRAGPHAQGCNQGACHGKGAGQNGFRLSLRGYAPEHGPPLDHPRVRRPPHRPRRPGDSLLLRKPTGAGAARGRQAVRRRQPRVPGAARLDRGRLPGPEEGRRRSSSKLEITPGRRVLQAGRGAAAPAEAEFTRRHAARRDLADASSSRTTPAWPRSIADGQVRRPAERRDGRPGDVPDRGRRRRRSPCRSTRPVDPARLSTKNNFIDEHVFAKLAAPAHRAVGPVHRRRVPPPRVPRHHRHAADAGRGAGVPRRQPPDKRAKLIDALLDRPEFVDYWTLQLGDLFQNRKERDHDVRGTKGVRAFHAWLRAAGGRQPAVGRARPRRADRHRLDDREPGGRLLRRHRRRARASRRSPRSSTSVAQAFLGTRIGCAQCHNHPLENVHAGRLTTTSPAFFSRVKLDRKDPKQRADDAACVAPAGPEPEQEPGRRPPAAHRRSS